MSLDPNTVRKLNIVIRGAGIIGLSIAFELARHGVSARILSQGRPEEKASWAAAGMLSAQFEALIEPDFSGAMHAFANESVALWPEFAAAISERTGLSMGYSAGPTLGLVRPDTLKSLSSDRRLAGVDLDADDSQTASDVPGLFAPGYQRVLFSADGQVDNRAVLKGLMQICGDFMSDDAALADNADILIDCRGWKEDGIRPVKGQMLALAPRDHHPKIPVRWGASYIVPKPDRIIIGATVEPDETDLATEEQRLDALLAGALDIIPDLASDMEIVEKWAGLRPMARRQRPIIGWAEAGRHYLATGHYRNGILLAPATARKVVADLLQTEDSTTFALGDLAP